MKKILFWSQIPPLNPHPLDKILRDNLIGSNSGNVMFQTSAARTVMTHEDDEFVSVFSGVRRELDSFAARANEECSCFIMPLANAFRGNYMEHLQTLTELLRRLTIPCAVMGVGIQANHPRELEQGYAFDDGVKAFVSAALDRSAMVGVRGGLTARYLKHLGFAEERHFTVIGCPSMYLRGGELPAPRPFVPSKNVKVALSSKPDAANAIHGALERASREFPDYWYIAQTLPEMQMMYAGVPVPTRKPWAVPDYLPMTRRSTVVKANHAIMFTSVPRWLDFMKDADLYIGCNIHGSVASVQAGAPALLLCFDLRVAEIAEYHHLCTIAPEALSQTTWSELAERTDFARILDGHGERFGHFRDFLDANGIDHIYHNADTVSDAPYDRRVRAISLAPALTMDLALKSGQRREAWPIWKAAMESYRRRAVKKIIRVIGRKG